MDKKFRKTIWIYGLSLAILITTIKLLEFSYLVRDLSLEFYIGVIAFFFTAFGIWIGLKIIGDKKAKVIEVPVNQISVDENAIKKLGISNREYEVLELMAQGFSNQEIADKLFVSLPTIKTHTSNLFSKLDVKRRTQAVQKAKDFRILV